MNLKTSFAIFSLFVCGLFLALIVAPSTTMGANPAGENLTIIFTSDIHSNFEPATIVIEKGRIEERGGLAGLAGIISRENLKAPDGVLVIDGGDFSMGTLMHTLYSEEAAELRMLGRLGYDATTLGNHEFDFGYSGLASMLQKAKSSGDLLPNLVVSNLELDPGSVSTRPLIDALKAYPAKDYAIIEKNGLKVGVFGLLGQDAAHDMILDSGLEVTDQIEMAKRVTSILRETEKVDVIVCLSHSGTLSKDDPEDELLAQEVPEIDFILSGHSHTTLFKPIMKSQTIIGSPGSNSRYAGILELKCLAGQRPTLLSYRLEEITPKTDKASTVDDQIDEFKAIVDRNLKTAYGLGYSQIVAESSFDMESLDEMTANAVESGVGDLIADAFRYAVQTAEGDKGEYLHVSVEPLGEIRSSFTSGPIAINELFEVLSLGQGLDGSAGYPLVSFYLNGKEIKNCLETQATMAPTDSKYNLQVSGIKFKYNPSRIPFDRVYDIQISNSKGEYGPILKEKLYRVCTPYYTAKMLAKMGDLSYGIISVTPKDLNGKPVKDLTQALVDADPDQAGIQELKEWTALADYLAAQPDLNGNGIPDVPIKYSQPAGRYQMAASSAPLALVRDSGPITWVVFGLVILSAVVFGLLARKLRMRFLGKPAGK